MPLLYTKQGPNGHKIIPHTQKTHDFLVELSQSREKCSSIPGLQMSYPKRSRECINEEKFLDMMKQRFYRLKKTPV